MDDVGGGAVTPWDGAPRPPRRWQAEALPLVVGAMRRRAPSLISATPRSGKSVLLAEVAWVALPRLAGRAVVVVTPKDRLVNDLHNTFAERLGAQHVGKYYGRKKQPTRDVIICCNDSLPRLHLDLASRGRKVALLMLDEAHRSQADGVLSTVRAMAPPALLGCTGTPYRSKKGEVLELFHEVVVEYGLLDAIRDGAVVPPRIVRIEGYDTDRIDEATLALMEQHARGVGPGVVSAWDIPDAERYAEWLGERGWRALPIHSRQSPEEQARRIGSLWTGETDCLVHVSLLSEGVTLPGLRWIAIRRNVGASVRWIQESMRVLGALDEPDRWGPKTEGIIIDPWLVSGRFGWSTPAAIYGSLVEMAEAEQREGGAKHSDREPTAEEATALDLLVSYLDDLRQQLLSAGILEPPKYDRGGWCLAAVTERQVEAIKGASKQTRHIPDEHRDAIKALVKVPYALTRGQAADLLDVLYGGARWARPRIDVEAGVYPNMVQWDARLVRVQVPDHEAILAAGRGGRKMAPAGEGA